MKTETNAGDGAQVLSIEELTEVRGAQEEVVPFLVGYLAGKALDAAYNGFSEWSNAQTHAPYTDSYSQQIDAANHAALEQDMMQQMDDMSQSY